MAYFTDDRGTQVATIVLTNKGVLKMKVYAYTLREFIGGNLKGLTFKSRDQVRSLNDLDMFENSVLKPISGFGSPYKIISCAYTIADSNGVESELLSANQVRNYVE